MREGRRVRHPRVVRCFLGILAIGFLALVLFGRVPSKIQSTAEGSGGTVAAQTEETQGALDGILEHLRSKEALSTGEISRVQAELDSALGDGKLHLQTTTHETGLTDSVNTFLSDEKTNADDVLLWFGYLGLLGESWGALLKTPEGAEIVVFSGSLNPEDSGTTSELQPATNTAHTLEERAVLYQSDWI